MYTLAERIEPTELSLGACPFDLLLGHLMAVIKLSENKVDCLKWEIAIYQNINIIKQGEDKTRIQKLLWKILTIVY